MPPTFPQLVHFQASEFQHPELMHVAFLRWLDRVRAQAGVAFHITNDARVPDAAEPPGSAGAKSLHRCGRAVDLRSRDWSVAEKWRVAAAIVGLADEAPGKVEWECVYSTTDHHWHLGVDENAIYHELIERDE